MSSQSRTQPLTSDEVRKLYLDYFQAKGHMLIPSSSLIPATNPTLLLTTAGMVQFVPFFLGKATPPARRMTSVQKCARTTDIDAVGDYKHLTFFEMLGNFSVGDYLKKDAIAFAWELLLQRFGLSRDWLYITVYTDDDEAVGFWHQEQHVPLNRIYRYGKDANWWGPPGDEGPCGPCSEMHYDFGAEYGCGPLASPDAIARWQAECERRQSLGQPLPEQPGCHPNCDRCERFMEIWNLVFMQFYQDTQKKLSPLPAPNIDTGMGLERIVTVLQGKRTVYDTDIFQPLLRRVAELAGKEYGRTSPPSPFPDSGRGQERERLQPGTGEEVDYAIRVVAEHARAATFLIADGVVPSNEGRGYVLRRIIRRTVRYGRTLGLTGPFLGEVVGLTVDRMAHAYPELAQTREFVLRVLRLEEERFGEVYERGLQMLASFSTNRKAKQTVANNIGTMQPDLLAGGGSVQAKAQRFNDDIAQYRGWPGGEIVELLQRAIENEANRPGAADTSLQSVRNRFVQSKWAETITGLEAFELHDTYGFPVEVTAEIAKEHGLDADMAGFKREMEEQRERARASAQFGAGARRKEGFAYESLGLGGTAFTGYDRTEQESVVLAVVQGGQSVASAVAGQDVEVILKETAFYGEKGGQVGDRGEIVAAGGVVEVRDTQEPVAGLHVHVGRVARGEIRVGDGVKAMVDPVRRKDTARNHTATHMLHAALRQVLGSHVRQAGSYVGPDRLRFDFSHVQALTPEELDAVERLVNEKVREDLPVDHHETTYTQAVQEGALAFFGETYGASVRVVEVGFCSASSGSEHSHGEGHAGRVASHLEHAHQTPIGARPSAGCFSKEVCGGTHLHHTGELGLVLIVGESSIGAGTRRLEAVTGRTAEALARERIRSLEKLAQGYATTPEALPQRLTALQEELAAARERASELERALLKNEVDVKLAQAGAVQTVTRGGAQVKTVALRLQHAATAEALREATDWVKNSIGSGVIALGAVFQEQPAIAVAATPDVVKLGVNAGPLARSLGQAMGGGGGGRPESATAGGKDASKLDAALQALAGLVGKG
jgi:alanyl-tRNA synthetase